jgi:RNA ligase
MTVEFKEFEKIPRLNRDVVYSEKIDGTNACVVVVDAEAFTDRQVFAQSRNRLITPEADNYGFARWVQENAEVLKQLGPGYHYGEWWGGKIGRGYGLKEKRFSLFNAFRWKDNRPACCHVVPTLPFSSLMQAGEALDYLRTNGSMAAPGFMDPEGIIAWHTAAQKYFKATCKNDETPKSKAV